MICPKDSRPCIDDLCVTECIRTGTPSLNICQGCKQPDELNGSFYCLDCWTDMDDEDEEPRP